MMLKIPCQKLPNTSERVVASRPYKLRFTIQNAGPFLCNATENKQRKLYLLLFTCSLSTAIHLEVLPNQATQKFIYALKQLIARRGTPKVIYSDNTKSFVAASNWIEKINKDELMQYLIREEIQWKFNLSRAPWWGGQFENMVGLLNQCLYKTTGRANLSQKEFEEIVLSIEVTVNKGPLMYVEEDIQMLLLTPNSSLYEQLLLLPDEDLDEDVPEMKRRQRYINKCKDAAWRRWIKPYLKTLRVTC